MTDTNNDSRAERKLAEEGNEIKQELTNKSRKVQPYKYNFTPVVELASLLPKFVKIHQYRKTHYVPDTFFLFNLLHRIFDHLLTDKMFRTSADMDQYGMTLYVAYAVMFKVLKLHNSSTAATIQSHNAEEMLEKAGIKNFILPIVFNKYFDGLGTYTDPISGRELELTLPPISQEGPPFNEYFFSPSTAHLLPNFRAIMTRALFIAPNSPNSVGQNNRNMRHYHNPGAQLPAYLHNTPVSRTQDLKIPGLRKLTKTYVSEELLTLINDNIDQNYDNNFLRYFQFNMKIINYLNVHYTHLFSNMDHFKPYDISNQGNDLLKVTLIESEDQPLHIHRILRYDIEQRPRHNAQPEIPGQNEVPPVQIQGQVAINRDEFVIQFKLYSKTMVTDGNLYYAATTPIIRIPSPIHIVEFPDIRYIDPNHQWFSRNHEFATSEISYEQFISAYRRI